MQKTIGVDLDEVLSETVDGVLKFHNYQINGIPAARSDITAYYLWDIDKFWMTKEDWVKYFRLFLDEAQSSDAILPVHGAKEWLERLKLAWWKITIVTARKEQIKDFTIHRLNNHFQWLRDEILFANHFSVNEVSKSQLCKQQWITTMVEDNLEYAKELANTGIKVYLLDKPWNSEYYNGAHPNIIKVASRDEIHV